MRAMILAAGRGERLRPLTDTTPKPLIKAGRWCLIEYQILALKKAGVTHIVINIAWLAERIRAVLGDGAQYGVRILYSDESEQTLETAGGIIKALPLLGGDPFIVCNADIWTDFDYANLHLDKAYLAHLVLVNNPGHHPQGDFSLNGKQLCEPDAGALTFSGIGLYHRALFTLYRQGRRALSQILYKGIENNLISGEAFNGQWLDVGTPSRLTGLKNHLQKRK